MEELLLLLLDFFFFPWFIFGAEFNPCCDGHWQGIVFKALDCFPLQRSRNGFLLFHFQCRWCWCEENDLTWCLLLEKNNTVCSTTFLRPETDRLRPVSSSNQLINDHPPRLRRSTVKKKILQIIHAADDLLFLKIMYQTSDSSRCIFWSISSITNCSYIFFLSLSSLEDLVCSKYCNWTFALFNCVSCIWNFGFSWLISSAWPRNFGFEKIQLFCNASKVLRK